MPCDKMNQTPLSESDIQSRIHKIYEDNQSFVRARQTPDKPFGHFNHCAHAFSDDEISATSVALELWKMLNMPITDTDLSDMMEHVQSVQNPETGLILDPGWKDRMTEPDTALITEGDSFFTRCIVAALKVWGKGLHHPIKYLLDDTPDKVIDKIMWGNGAHAPYALGDLMVLLEHNAEHCGAGTFENAKQMHQQIIQATRNRQDAETGLWVEPYELRGKLNEPDATLTYHINRTFHIIKFIYNIQNMAIPHADRMIDTCLRAKDDERFYSWQTGYACNDLDLALVFYAASRWSDHRQQEVMTWARQRLPMILQIQKEDGGFSFFHDRAKEHHFHLKTSPGAVESDLWGCLMYLGTINMMARMGYPGIEVPWGFSMVHAVPEGPVSTQV